MIGNPDGSHTPISSRPEEVIESLVKEGEPTAAALAVLLTEHCKMLNGHGWDQSPELWTIERMLPPSEVAEELAEHGASGLALQANMIGYDWSGHDGPLMASAMRHLAEAMRKDNKHLQARVNGRDIVAWMLTNEAWMVTGSEKVNRRLERGGRIADDPTRVEIRILIAVDRAGYCYQIIQPRGQEPMMMLDRDGSNLVGNLVDGLRELTEATPV